MPQVKKMNVIVPFCLPGMTVPSTSKHYGSSENAFGGSLKSALKSTIKQPIKRTTR
jgi:hypothetical protein